ncbi:MAG: hypothetical protein C4582_08770 [Desulfobacteraceae bacterium]|nr:MAG: hypothetical protein C4582_08770 [Desulfobacteraceae bacterium]
MEKFFYPSTVAVVGATPDRYKGGNAIFSNINLTFSNGLYPVNPRYRDIDGVRCWENVSSIPEVVDLVIAFIPAPGIPDLIDECGKKGIKRVMIQSAGFAETGGQGRLLQDRCVKIAKSRGIRLWGPNCMGLVNGHTRFVASFMRPFVWEKNLTPGGVSVIVQSGMLSAGFLMQVLSEGYFGLSKACSIGNRCDINESDILEYLKEDETTRVVGLYLESIVDIPRFRRAVLELGRPVVLLKGGISPGGAKAAVSHTGSLAGDTRLAEEFFRQLGIHRAYDIIELMDMVKGLNGAGYTKNRGRRVAVVTFSGAAGIVTADHFAGAGLELAELNAHTTEVLKTVFPPWMSPDNPVDIWPSLEQHPRSKTYSVAVNALLRDPGVDGICIHFFADPDPGGEYKKFLDLLDPVTKPVVVWMIGDTRLFRGLREMMEAKGMLVYNEIGRGVEVLGMLLDGKGSRG